MTSLLFIEDDDSIRLALTLALEDEGYEVREAADGRTGLDMFAAQEPDLVLLDLRLPDMSGFEVARQLRAGSIVPITTRSVSIFVLVAPSVANGTVLNATVTAASASPDPNMANNTASTANTVATEADLLLGFSAPTTQVAINVPVNFTATSLNQGPSDAQDVSVTITLTPDFRYAGHTATGATCTTPQVGTTGAIVCTWAGATAPGVTRTLVVSAFSNTEGQTGVNASTTSATTDPVANNNLGGATVQVGYLVEEIPTLSSLGLILMGLLFGLIGFVAVRREM